MSTAPKWAIEASRRARNEPDYAYVPSATLACIEGDEDEGFAALDDFTPFDAWDVPRET